MITNILGTNVAGNPNEQLKYSALESHKAVTYFSSYFSSNQLLSSGFARQYCLIPEWYLLVVYRCSVHFLIAYITCHIPAPTCCFV